MALAALACGVIACATARAAGDEPTCVDYARYNPLVSWTRVRTDEIRATDCHLCVNGSIIWVAAQSHLLSYEVRNDDDLHLIHAELIPPSPDGYSQNVYYVTAVGNTAFTTGAGGLTVWDISDPARPVVLSRAVHTYLDRAVYRDGYLYAISGYGIVVVDVRDPGAPVFVSSYTQTSPVKEIDLRGNEILLGSTGRLSCLTQGADHSLTLKWEMNIGTVPNRFACAGEYLFVTEGVNLLTFRYRGEEPPVLLASRQMYTSGTVKVVGRRLYVYGLLGLHVFDLDSAPDLDLINLMRSPYPSQPPSMLGDLLVSTTIDGLLTILDPNVNAIQPPVGLIDSNRLIRCLGTSGSHVFALYQDNYVNSGVIAFDVSDPHAPRIAGQLQGLSQYLDDIRISGNFLFTNRLYCVDISDPAHMRLINGVPLATRTAFAGGVAYMTEYGGLPGITAADVTDPAHPVMLGNLDLNGVTPVSLAADGSTVVAAGDGALYVVDVASPAAMRLRSTLLLPYSPCRGLAYRDNVAYLAGPGAAISIVNLSDPDAPELSSTLPLPFDTCGQGIIADRGMVYVTSRTFGVLVVDAADPASPQLLGYVNPQFEDSFQSMTMTASDNQLVMASNWGFLQVSPLQCARTVPMHHVVIDVEPADDCNRVSCHPHAHDRISVAILSDKAFSAADIDPASLRFGPGQAMEIHYEHPAMARPDDGREGGRSHSGRGNRRDPRGSARHLVDIDCDGDIDFVAHFDARAAAFACGDSIAELSGLTVEGEELYSSAPVSTSRHCRRGHAGDPVTDANVKSLRSGAGCGEGGNDADKQFPIEPLFAAPPSASPNPFNPATEITFALQADAELSVIAYDIAGRRLAEIASGPFQAGPHTLTWHGLADDGQRLPSGVYFLAIVGGDEQFTLRVALIR